ncbi:hypothetical protein DPEC_G00178070 [Dallia pectoralis]|uniref:Uncharacterized protein n=1 Tax=Dallia pectoralis TaxID=75939 RepID=A0ACC2GFF1_DALPE|nr:hypothetical protein DPEC_G00178070 [Dallia pectoralis]
MDPDSENDQLREEQEDEVFFNNAPIPASNNNVFLPVLDVSEDEEDMERPQLLRPPWPGLDIRCSWPAQTDSTCLQYHTTEDPIVEEACLAPWNIRRTNSAQRAPWPNERNRRALFLCLLPLRSRWIVGKKRAKVGVEQQKKKTRTSPLSSISAASTASDQLFSCNSTPSPPSSAEDLPRPGSPPKFTSCLSPWPLSDHSSPRPQSRRSDAQGQIFTRSKKTVRKRVRYRAVVKLEPLGLPNIGNSCFLNATLQCLLFLPMFFREILRQETLWRMCPFSNLLSSLAEVHLSCQPGSGANLASKVKSMWKVMYALMEQEVKYIGGNQQDAHEFLLDLLCQLKLEGRLLEDFATGYICPVSHLDDGVSAHLYQLWEEDVQRPGVQPPLPERQPWTDPDGQPGTELQGSLSAFSSRSLGSVLVLYLNRFGGTWDVDKMEVPVLFPPPT